ncbi:30S ribosomal protein S13 [Candidatus Gracilibacteria bacterium]|nr:30S ribosomal protein S13 [Candidatus Gracilibacteria bacterium]NJS41273.1 30S ribosomal protein S13 [Candidatus Gracilibacteria bacterium]
MIRIAGVTLDDNKEVRFALTPIKGIGKSNVRQILKQFKIKGFTKLKDLEEKIIIELRNYIETNFIVEADLRRQHQGNIKRLVDISSWRGKRHKNGLPVRGQTTRTNSRTRRGNVRKTAGSGRAKAASKT